MAPHRVQLIERDFNTALFFYAELPRIMAEVGITQDREEVVRLLADGQVQLNGKTVTGKEEHVAIPHLSLLRVGSVTIELVHSHRIT